MNDIEIFLIEVCCKMKEKIMLVEELENKRRYKKMRNL